MQTARRWVCGRLDCETNLPTIPLPLLAQERATLGLGGVGDTVHQLEQEDILSCVRVWLATIAYADILLCSIGGIYNISNGKKLLPAFHR
jgi:hypothetical protein